MPHTYAKWLHQADKFLILRGLAALSVVFYHTQDLTRSILKPLEIGHIRLDWLFMPDGPMAVRIFFTLSGFLMFKAFYTHRYDLTVTGLKRFFRNRLRRIVPLYYFIAIMIIILITPEMLRYENWHVLARVLLFIYNGQGPPDFVVPFWSLSTEMQFYVIVPLLIWLSRRFITTTTATVVAIIGVTGLWPLLRWAVWHFQSHIPHFTYQASFNAPLLLNLDSFLIGGLVCILLYRAQPTLSPSPHRRRWIVAFTIIAISIFPILSFYHFVPRTIDSYRLLGPTVATLLTAAYMYVSEHLGSAPRPGFYRLRQVIRHPGQWLEFLGALSYGVYLWHAPLIDKATKLIADTGWKDYFLKGSLVAAFSLLLAYLTYRYVEAAARPAPTAKP